MTLAEFFTAIAQLSGLLFIVTSMLAMGMSLTMPQIIQPLKNVRLVILALLLFIIGSLVIGFVLGGRDPAVRSVMGLGTAQRNVSAAILLLQILLPTARQLGARAQKASGEEASEANKAETANAPKPA